MNVIELLAGIQAQHDKTAARADELRDQIQHLTAALTETETRLANLVTTQKVIAELAPASGQPRTARDEHRLPGHREHLQPASRSRVPSP
ncbi:hypothetical protein ACFY9S_19695 [Streptomyces sp. NPDC012474]|uniref:hypothetical protein n=1 Tax=Streptomyces sp. NPDC012474 TaxID=3364836 RepID=UPI0036E35C22